MLLKTFVFQPRTEDEMPEKLDKRKIRALKEKLRQKKAKEKLRQKQKKSKNRSSTSKCEADTSSDPGRKIKDSFRLSMASVIVHHLNVYRKPDCKFGKITNTEDFKHLARKVCSLPFIVGHTLITYSNTLFHLWPHPLPLNKAPKHIW